MGVVAFHAYLSHDSSGPLPMHHILKYDMIPLNKGNGYNAFDGIFIVPTSGTYVFKWSIMCDVHGSLYTELMRNAEIIGTRIADSVHQFGILQQGLLLPMSTKVTTYMYV